VKKFFREILDKGPESVCFQGARDSFIKYKYNKNRRNPYVPAVFFNMKNFVPAKAVNIIKIISIRAGFCSNIFVDGVCAGQFYKFVLFVLMDPLRYYFFDYQQIKLKMLITFATKHLTNT
jgi:hypothetical protein